MCWDDIYRARAAASRTHRFGWPVDVVETVSDDHGLLYVVDTDGIKWRPYLLPSMQVRRARFHCDECSAHHLHPWQTEHARWCPIGRDPVGI